MAKYLVSGNYLGGAGVQGLVKEGGTSRVDAIKKLVKSAGGKVDSVYYAFGEHDVYVIVDLPDNGAAAALALAVNSTGVVSVRTTVLMTPAEVDEAVKKTISYRQPGG